MIFNPESVRGAVIKEGQEYQGVRVTFQAFLGTAQIKLQVDIGFGDAVTPEAETIVFLIVLDFPAPELKAYPKETVIAEKFEAMVKLGMLNSRMKDFWDLSVLTSEFEFDGALLQKAIRATFERRQTAFPEKLPTALTEEFAEDNGKQTQWKAFLRKNKLTVLSENENSTELKNLIESLREFFIKIIEVENKKQVFDKNWRKGSWR